MSTDDRTFETIHHTLKALDEPAPLAPVPNTLIPRLRTEENVFAHLDKDALKEIIRIFRLHSIIITFEGDYHTIKRDK